MNNRFGPKFIRSYGAPQQLFLKYIAPKYVLTIKTLKISGF